MDRTIMKNKAYIDVELFTYRHACANEYEYELYDGIWSYYCQINDAKFGVDAEIQRLDKLLPDYEMVMALGSSTNFRYSIEPSYKSNRRKYRRPAGYAKLREWISETWPIVTFQNLEADDAIGVSVRKNDVIVSGDKDLKTIPGLHLIDDNIVRVTEREADMHFYKQILVGDRADNFFGCPGIGDQNKLFKSEEWLNAKSTFDLWKIVKREYDKAEKKDPGNVPDPWATGRLARILRQHEYFSGDIVYWQPPTFDMVWDAFA
tara:strand:- start:922 stop:1707 length:786 start_codon:yes stop_codon:yes gene_type:complete